MQILLRGGWGLAGRPKGEGGEGGVGRNGSQEGVNSARWSQWGMKGPLNFNLPSHLAQFGCLGGRPSPPSYITVNRSGSTTLGLLKEGI